MKTPLDRLTALADAVSGGHFTIYKFTTNYRVGLGTVEERYQVDKMAVGLTLDEAIESLLKKVKDRLDGEDQ